MNKQLCAIHADTDLNEGLKRRAVVNRREDTTQRKSGLPLNRNTRRVGKTYRTASTELGWTNYYTRITMDSV